jgi:hypothetical protein
MIFEPVVHSAQIVNLSCIKLCTLQIDQNEHPLEPSHYECHQVCPKWFLCLWYVWCKPYTYLAITLTLPPNGLNRYSTWQTSPKRSIGCVQNNFLSLWYVWHKPCTYLASAFALSQNRPNRASTLALSPRSTIWVRPKWFLSQWYVRCKPCTYVAPMLTLSPKG